MRHRLHRRGLLRIAAWLRASFRTSLGRRLGHELREDRNPPRLTQLTPYFMAKLIHLIFYTVQAMFQLAHLVLELANLAQDPLQFPRHDPG